MKWVPFLSFVIAACYTPGPNIIYAMNTAMLFGFRRTIPLMYGMTAGLFIIMALNALGNIFVASIMPQVIPYMRAAGSLYLLWLAWKIAMPPVNSAEANNKDIRTPGIIDGFVLQFLNPKVILFGFTAMSAFIAPWTDSKAAFFICGIFLTLNCAAAFVLWALFGDAQNRLFSQHRRIISVIMGILLAWSAFSVSGAADFFR